MTERELLGRLDRTIERSSQAIELNARAFQQLVESHARLERSCARLERALDDLRDQIAANTEALLRLSTGSGPSRTPGPDARP